MHRLVREHLEEVLAGSNTENPASGHLAECEECRNEVAGMRRQAALLRQWQVAPELGNDAEPRAGFYARVMERIEAQGPGSIWSLFFDSVFGRRIAIASLALALLLGVYLVSTEQMAETDVASFGSGIQVLPESMMPVQGISQEDQPGAVLTQAPDQDSVLVNLVTYQEQ